MIISTEIIVTVMMTVRVKVQIATVAVDLVIIIMMAVRPDARSEGSRIRLRLFCRQKTAASC